MKKFLLLPLLLLSHYASAVESTLLNQVEQLPINYNTVKTCGSWHADDKDGYYRLVVGDVYDGAGSEVYVQWITNATQEKHAELVKTLAFKELNNDHLQYLITNADCQKDGKSWTIKLKASFEHDEHDEVHRISIKLIDIGAYQLTDKVAR